jgi:transcriptional regulator with XRE-family HTH domain
MPLPTSHRGRLLMADRIPGEQLRAIRRAAGLSARELADALGLTARSIERIETRAVRPQTYARHLTAIRQVLADRLATVDELIPPR